MWVLYENFIKLAATERNVKVPACVFGLSRDEYASHTNP